jgi:hypothetical protein
LRCSEDILLVYLVAFLNLIPVNGVLQFFFLIAMTLYIRGSVGADDDRHQKLPFADSSTLRFCCLLLF